jgi:tetratricopeptide (TPR) repeat protein
MMRTVLVLAMLVAYPATGAFADVGGYPCAQPTVRTLTAPGSPAANAQDPSILQLETLLFLERVKEATELANVLLSNELPPAERGRVEVLRAQALHDAGRTREAREALELAIARGDIDRETRCALEVERARLDLEQDRLDRVIDALSARPGSTPRCGSVDIAWLVLARAHARLGDLGRAAPLCETFLERAPNSPEAPSAWHLLSRAAAARGDQAAWAELVRRAEESARWQSLRRARLLQLIAEPEAAEPRLGLALLWLEAGEPQRAGEHLRVLVSQHPEHVRGWFHLGELERARGNVAEARTAWDRALAVDPDDGPTLRNRGLLSLLEGRNVEARTDLARLVGTGAADTPPLLSGRLHLARALEALGRLREALAAYDAYRELGGTEPLAPPSPDGED